MDERTRDKILQANIEVHRLEARFYERIHREIFNAAEQARLRQALFDASAAAGGAGRALDIGCGTGNLTEKLLELGWTVDAVDLSQEMAEVLRVKQARAVAEGRLKVSVGRVEQLGLEPGYGIIVTYSVLHHLPDYLEAVSSWIDLLAPGGVLYLDHEVLGAAERGPGVARLDALRAAVYRALRVPYVLWRKILKTLAPAAYAKLLPNIDYTWSDYWVHDGRFVDAQALGRLAQAKGCAFERRTYLLHHGLLADRLFHSFLKAKLSDTQLMILRKGLSPVSK